MLNTIKINNPKVITSQSIQTCKLEQVVHCSKNMVSKRAVEKKQLSQTLKNVESAARWRLQVTNDSKAA